MAAIKNIVYHNAKSSMYPLMLLLLLLLLPGDTRGGCFCVDAGDAGDSADESRDKGRTLKQSGKTATWACCRRSHTWSLARPAKGGTRLRHLHEAAGTDEGRSSVEEEEEEEAEAGVMLEKEAEPEGEAWPSMDRAKLHLKQKNQLPTLR